MAFAAASPWSLLFLASAAAAVSAPAAPDESARQLVLTSAVRDADEQALQRNYTYRELVEERQLDEAGASRKVEIKEFDVTSLYGHPYRRLIARDGRPLNPKEEQAEARKLDREMARRAGESDHARRKRQAEEAKELKEEQEFRREIADAFLFTRVAAETVAGQLCHVIQAEPKPGYRPRTRQANILTRVRGRLWISQTGLRWVKVEAETTGTYSLGWFLLRVAKGTRFRIQFERVGGEVWMPSQVWMRGDARVAGLKRYRMEIRVDWREFKKFQTDSRLLVGDAAAPAGAPSPR